MAKYDFSVAFAAAAQTAEGTFNSTLDGISATLAGDPGGTDDGLLLGDPESGIGQSGLSIGIGRGRREKAPLSGSFTTPLADFLRAEVPTLSFSFPFCGNRGTTSATAADADFVPLTGVDAILNGAGLTGTAWGSGVGHSYKFGSVEPFSALVYVSGSRLELLDCRCSRLAIEFTPGSIPIATADISVGRIKDPSAASISVASLPTLTYGEQATVSAPTVESTAHTWQALRGFSSLTLAISPEIEEIADSNAADGSVKEIAGRTTTIDATIFSDDASTNEVYELDQIFQTASSGLDQLSFQVGSDAGDASTAVAVQYLAPQPEVTSVTPVELGSKAGVEVSLELGHSTANSELELIFR